MPRRGGFAYNLLTMTFRRLSRVLFCCLFSFPVLAQEAPGDTAPTFRVPASALSSHVTVIAYGDQRFHDPSNTSVADPKARLALVRRIAQEKPDALQMSGD